MTSERLFPKLGGLSTVANILTRGFKDRDHDLVIVTTDPDSVAVSDATPVIKLTSLSQWWRYFKLLLGADVVLQNNISVKTLILPLLMRKRTVVALHIWLATPDGKLTWREHLKIALLRQCTKTVTPNLAIVERFGGDGEYVTNAYDESTFNVRQDWHSRERTFVVVARLIKEKGVRELIEAFAIVSPFRPGYCLTVIGTGPEEANLKRLTTELCLANKVRFLGALNPPEVAKVLNNSRIMCVPSMWEEVFGIVALEGLGCGIPVIATAVSGLVDAHHGFGILVDPADKVVEKLADAMIEMTISDDTPLQYLTGVNEYLLTRNREAMVDAYESAMVTLD